METETFCFCLFLCVWQRSSAWRVPRVLSMKPKGMKHLCYETPLDPARCGGLMLPY